MNNNYPFITVFTPNFNKDRFISETIESIINQNYSNFEYIIIDDCSTDNSWQIIQKYAKIDKRIIAYRNKKNLGIVKTRNKGFKYSSTESKYFAIIDSDDVALPYRLMIQVNFLETNPKYGLVGSNIIIIDENSKIIGYRRYPSEDKEIRKVITRYDPFAQPSIMLRKEVINKIGNYDEQWQVSQDYEYFLRLGMYWKFKNLENPLIKYRLSANQAVKTRLKDIIINTYKIQKIAVEEYGYYDSLLNKLFRFFLKSLTITPRLLYMVNKFIFIKKI